MMATLYRDRSGAAAMEFALVMPLFLALVIGSIELARWGWGAAALRLFAAQAARCVVTDPERCGSSSATRATMAAAMPLLSKTAWLEFERVPCGIRVSATGGMPAVLTPGLGETTAVVCVD